jgi:hypothetical protein
MRRSILYSRWLAAFVLLLFGAGCRTTYYSLWETFGKEKRDLLKDNVEKTRDAQAAATEQFKDALTNLKELYGFQGGELEKMYDRIKADYDRSANRADTVRTRIKKMEQVANDLFAEWEKEIDQMESPNLKSSSRQRLSETRSKYGSLSQSMRRAEQSMEPVLRQFRDQVLYLKHNLNAQAIGALKGEAAAIESEIRRLVKDMDTSIAEADAFIQGLPAD